MQIMDTTSVIPINGQKEKQSPLTEVVNVEKQLWLSINTKGLLHSDVQDLYRNVRASYEKIILSDPELAELQDVEYSLWKLHYRHIDEFRKRIKKTSSIEETTKTMLQIVVATQTSNDNHKERFKSFLSEATTFYRNIIRKLLGLPEDFFFYRGCLNSATVEPKKMKKMQFLCHRFLVCLGDLARYTEQCEKSEIKNHNWSVAVTHYLEATMIWPDSGNPQNQLAVLAMYVGDEFLALYHCIRSLAVKEPFPDALNNLILLFERNRSSDLHSLSSEAHFDFLKPSESNFKTKSQPNGDLSNCKMMKADHENEGTNETDLWPLIIRMISFFFVKSSMDDYPCTFASTIRELDALLASDDEKLKVSMESYQHLDSARNGPFRTLQFVSVFIFVIEDLINSPEVKESKNSNDMQQLLLTQLALTATFIFMGRLVERCLKANSLESCPLLPGLLVFVEWLVNILDEAEKYGSDDDKSTRAMTYFFCVFLELLKRLEIYRSEVSPPVKIALWEDYELRGFKPLTRSPVSLDFSTHQKNIDNFESGDECRACRIINAAMKIADRSNSNQKWLFYDKSGRKFSLFEPNKFSKEVSEKAKYTSTAVEVKQLNKHEITEECDKPIIGEEPSNSNGAGKPASVEEEEVILFKPLTRYNSAPLYTSSTSAAQIPPKDIGDLIVPADECLRRATSVLIAQNEAQGNPPAFHSDLTNFKQKKPLKQQELLSKDSVVHQFSEPSLSPAAPSFSPSISAGPPSLNAWVINRGILNNDRVKGKSDTSKPAFAPIEEIPSISLDGLSINRMDSVISSGHEFVAQHYSSPDYAAIVPSAPLLPDDAVWFGGMQPITFSDYNGSGSISRMDSLIDAPQVSGYSKWTGSHQLSNYGHTIPGFTEGYPPTRRMTSSEWLRQYRESQNLERTTSHLWPPIQSYASGNTGLFQGHDISMSGGFDQWGTPLAFNPLNYEGNPLFNLGFPSAYGTDDQRREKLFHGYQRVGPYGCGTVSEPEPLLLYLKEREWLHEQNPNFRGPTYMGS